MRKKGMVWFSLLLLLISFLPSFLQAYVVHAQSPDEVKQTVIQSNYLNVSTTAKQVDQELIWEIDYSIGVPAENHTRRIKIKVFNQDERNVIQPEQLSGWVTSADNWFQTEALSQTGKGKVVIRTALDVKELQLKVQLDEEVINEIEVAGESPDETTTTQEKVFTENILEAPFANSHTLSAPIVQASAESTSSSTSVEESPVETTEADSQVTETDTSEESTNTTETSKTESSPSESSEGTESKSLIDDVGKVGLPFSRMSLKVTPFATNPYVDRFDYTEDAAGIYPTQWSNRYLPDTRSNNDIRNFNYLQTVTGRANNNKNAGQTSPANQVVNILNSNTFANILDSNGNVIANPNNSWTNFSDGYVGYWQPNDVKNLNTALEKFSKQILNKKTVKATNDPTKFDIELDVIGGVTVKPDRKVDIVFVLDKSASMDTPVPGTEKTRWGVLQDAMTKFTDTLLTPENETGGYVRMGLAGFGSDGSSKPFGEVGHFGSNRGFTAKKKDLNDHPLIKNSQYSNSGTPTFLGLDAGRELLINPIYGARADAEKVIIILTDGLPTFGKGTNYDNLTVGSVESTSGTGLTSKKRFTFENSRNTSYFTGNGSSTQNGIAESTKTHANNRADIGIDRYSIGFGVTGVTDILTALGPKMQGEATSAQDLDNILAVFANAIGPKVPFINNGTLNDPMSQYVNLDVSSVTVSPLTLDLATGGNTLTVPTTIPTYITNIDRQISTGGITLSKVTLSGEADANRINNKKFGLRLKYTVTLKPEFQNGQFYPTNKPTFLDQADYVNAIGFTVPSVRYNKTINIPVEKIWNDDNNDWNTRRDITLQLQRQNGSNWENVANNAFAIAKTATGNALKHTFSNLPSYANGQVINYRIVEIPARVLGYDPGVPTPVSTNVQANDKTLKMTNNLKKIPLGKFTKINQNGDKLTGVKFKLFKADGTTQIGSEVTSSTTGEVDFSNISLPVGTYILKETVTLPGYEPMAPRTITVTDNGTTAANLVVTGLDDRPNENGNQIVNYLRLFTLKVTKEDNRGNALEGATFTLKRTIPTPETPITGTTNQNIFTFVGLSAGTYILTETSPPNGYIGVEPMTVVINANGQVTINGVVQEATPTEGETLIELTVKNKEKGQLPSTGGRGTQQFLFAALALASIAGVIAIYYVYRNRKEAE